MRVPPQLPTENANGDLQHPAFGTVVITQAHHGHGASLFQSDILHKDTINISFHEADLTRSYGTDRAHPRKQLLEISLSRAQWAEVISSIGQGSGTPCTITRIGGRPVPGIEFESRIQKNLDEVNNATADLIEDISEAFDELNQAFEDKSGIKVIREKLRTLSAKISNAPANSSFAVKTLKRASEMVVAQAKAEVESHVMEVQRNLGKNPQIETLTSSFEIEELQN